MSKADSTASMWIDRNGNGKHRFEYILFKSRMDRNYLKGTEGDKINAFLAGCGFNIRKLLRAILLWLFKAIQGHH